MYRVPTQTFRGLTRDWAVTVARQLGELAGDRDPRLDDLWISDDLALNVRYRIGRDLMAVRVERLDVDPTSAIEPVNSAQLASNLLHNLHAPAEPDWVDGDGYVWWGDRPAGGWSRLLSGTAVVVLGGRPVAGSP